MATFWPYIQFYPAEYLRDTRGLSLAAKGAWMDILCSLHHAPNRGVMAMTMVSWARLLGAGVDETAVCISELDALKIAGVSREMVQGHEIVTLMSRRMVREGGKRFQATLRKRRQRDMERDDEPDPKGEDGGHADVTPESRDRVRDRYQRQSQKQSTESTRTPRVVAAATKNESAQPDLAGFPPPAADAPVTVMTFPTVGKAKDWALSADHMAEIQRAYPDLNVKAECMVALGKICHGAVTKKTPGGMTKFLWSWMDRSQNRKRSNGANPRPPGQFEDAFAHH